MNDQCLHTASNLSEIVFLAKEAMDLTQRLGERITELELENQDLRDRMDAAQIIVRDTIDGITNILEGKAA